MKTFDNMSYRRRIQWRIRLEWLLIIILLIFMVVVGETGGGDSRCMNRMAEQTSRGLYFGGLGYLGWRIYHNKKLLQDIRLLKQSALQEQDEMNRSLHLRSGGYAMDAILVILYVATMTSSLYNMDMFHMALGLLVAAVVIKVAARWWCEEHE